MGKCAENVIAQAASLEKSETLVSLHSWETLSQNGVGVPKIIVLWNFVTKSKLKASLAVSRNLLPYIFQGGLQPL